MIFKINNVDCEFNIHTKELKVNDKIYTPNVRTYFDMENMYIKKEKLDKDEGLYFMYRGVYLNEDDKKLFKDNNLRYDITVLLPRFIGDEYNKTFGHYHPIKSDGKRYEEIYEVLSGSAIYLQQNNKEVNFTNAFVGDKVVMNEGFGHITINPSDKDILVMANIVDDNFDSEYGEYKDLKGGNYYYTNSGFILNSNYKNDLPLDELKEYFEGGDMYNQFLENPEKFNFLH